MADAIKGAYDLISNQKKKEGSSIRPKDFFWDQFLKYISSAILALTVLNVTVEFLRGGGVSCFPPSDNVPITARDLEGKMFYDFGRDQASYINNYCARGIPKTEYFPIYILVHGLLLIVPHFIWSTLHNGDFDSFFSIVEKLDRLRDSKTGEYDTNNFDRVTKLEQEYSGQKIYYTYILKLLIQLIVCIGSVVFSAAFFHNFSFIFFCPGEPTADDFACPADYIDIGTPCGWPLNLTVPCVYTSLRVLSLIRYADYFLLVIATGLILYGLVWCIVRHTEQLGYSELAKFSFQSCLKPENFVFPPIISWPTYSCFTSRKNSKKTAVWVKRFWIFTHYPKPNLKQIIKPRILHDLDFLLLILFRADNSHGEVFKDIQTTRELKRIVGRDHQLLHLYINIQQDLPPVMPPTNEHRASRSSTPESENGCWSCFSRQNSSLEENASNDERTTSNNAPVDQVDGEEQSELNQHQSRAVDEFHRLFRVSDFNTENAEKSAYERYKPHLGGIEILKEHAKGIRDVIFWFVTNFGPTYEPSGSDPLSVLEQRNDLALDISFGSIGYSLVLARPFVKVLSVQFQPHYQNTSKNPVLKDEFYTNYITFKFPSNLYSQSNQSITGAQSSLLRYLSSLEMGGEIPPARLDYIMIGPITEESKLVSVNLLLNSLYSNGRIGKDAILLAVRPLKIGLKKVKQRFFKFVPSKLLFDHNYHERNVTPKIPKKSKHTVEGCSGISVQCGTTPCVFEMIAYRFIGEIFDIHVPHIAPFPTQGGPQVLIRGPPNSQETAFGETFGSPLSSDSGLFSPLLAGPGPGSVDIPLQDKNRVPVLSPIPEN